MNIDKPYFQRYENMDTHWFACKVCGGVSWDSDTAALAGMINLSDKDVSHNGYCPGKAFPEKHIQRVTRR